MVHAPCVAPGADGGRVSSPWLAWRHGEDVALLSRRVHSAYESFLATASDAPASDAIDTGRPGPGTTATAVRPLILDSWVRSRDRGVDPDSVGAAVVLDDAELKSLRDSHPLAAVVPVVRRLLVQDATETGLLVAITDARGRMLWVEGDPTLRRRAASMRFVEGADWSEAAAGTNAPGTALTLDHSVQIFGAEHFSRSVQPWSCSAAPVHDPRTGELLGVIDVTGGDRVAAPEMLTLVRVTAAAAESELLLRALDARVVAGSTARLTLLGRDRPRLHIGGSSIALSLRHAEILLLLAERPEGMGADELAVELAEGDLDTVTVRAEVSRLRRAVGAELVGSRPYRLTLPLRTDVAEVRAELACGDRAAAVRACRGPVLPASVAPGVVAVREELRADVRAALLGAPQDTTVLIDWLATPQGRDDTGMWQALLTVLPAGSPMRDRARARVNLPLGGPGPLPLHGLRTHRATPMQRPSS